MPHASLKLLPTVNQNRTPALNEAGISESQLIRFMVDDKGVALPQKLGGWEKFYPTAMDSTVRALLAWADEQQQVSWCWMHVIFKYDP